MAGTFRVGNPASVGTPVGTTDAVRNNDSRLSDARTPTAHQHDAGDITGTLSVARIPTGTTGTTVALGNHTHAAAQPAAHASTHASAGSDPVTPAAIGAAAASHTHSDPTPTASNVTGSLTPDAAVNTRYNYTMTGNVTLNPPSNGGDQDEMTMFFSASGATRVLTFSTSLYGLSGAPASISIPSGEEAFVRLRRSVFAGRWVVERASLLTALSSLLEYVGAGSWGTGAATVAGATYPAGLQQNDVLVFVLHMREGATTAPTISGWTKQYESSIGSGTVADSTGPTRLAFYTQVVGASPPSGALGDFSSMGTPSAGGVCHAFRPRSGTTLSYAGAVNSRTTASTSLAGTTGTIALAAGDYILTGVGAPDDTVTDITLSSVTAAGITLGSTTRSPDTTQSSATGNDRAEATFVTPVNSGTGTVGVAYAGTQTTSETGGTVAFRIRAT